MTEQVKELVKTPPLTEITEAEKKEILDFIGQADKDALEYISMIVRAFEGRPIDSDDVITRLINIKLLMERSRYPTYPQVGLQVYLRLIAHYLPEAGACVEWADTLSHALIAYKGENWKAYVDMAKGQQLAAQQEFYFGQKQSEISAQQAQPRGRWPWSRAPKPPPSEFRSE